jgi:hypothetical protein
LSDDFHRCYIIRVASPLGLGMEHHGDGEIEIKFDDQVFMFNERTAPIFRCFENYGPVSVGDFFDRFESDFKLEELEGLLYELIKSGIVVLTCDDILVDQAKAISGARAAHN